MLFPPGVYECGGRRRLALNHSALEMERHAREGGLERKGTCETEMECVFISVRDGDGEPGEGGVRRDKPRERDAQSALSGFLEIRDGRWRLQGSTVDDGPPA